MNEETVALTNEHEVTLKVAVRARQITLDNIEQFAKELDGDVENGILEFYIQSHKWLALPGDWFLIYSTGDVEILTDSFFNRLYKSV